MYSFLRLCEAVTAARAAPDLAVHLYAPFVLRTYWRVSVSVQSVTERNRPSSSCSNVSSSAPRDVAVRDLLPLLVFELEKGLPAQR